MHSFQYSRRNHTDIAASSSSRPSNQQGNPTSRNRQGNRARRAQGYPDTTESCSPTMSHMGWDGEDSQGGQRSFTELLNPGGNAAGHPSNSDHNADDDAYAAPGGLEAACHTEAPDASDAATPPGNAPTNSSYGAEGQTESSQEVQTPLLFQTPVQVFDITSSPTKASAAHLVPQFSYGDYGSLALSPHDPTGQGYLSQPPSSAYYYTQADFPQVLTYRPSLVVAAPPPRSSRSQPGFFPPVPRPESLTNDLTVAIQGVDREYPLLACVKDEYENSYMHAATATRLGMVIRPLPSLRQKEVFTPLGTYETPKSYSLFTANIDALGVKGLSLRMLNLDWTDSGLAQVILGSKLLNKISRLRGIGLDGSEIDITPGDPIPQGTSYHTGLAQQLQYGNNRPEGSFPTMQHYGGRFDQESQRWSQASVMSWPQESPIFTVVPSMSSATSANEESILALDNGDNNANEQEQ